MENQKRRIFDLSHKSLLLLFLLWALWLTVEYFGLGPFSYLRIHDWGDSFLPMILALKEQVFNQGLGFWFPYVVGGVDRLAFLLDIFHVHNLFFLTLPGWLAQGLFKFLQIFLAGFFTYKLSKDDLHLSKGASVLTGLIYSISFSRLIYGSAHHTMIYSGLLGPLGLPFILWTLERIDRRKTKRYLFALGLGVATSFASSFHLTFPFMFVVILVWFLLIKRKRTWGFWILLSTYFVSYLVVSSPNIIAMLKNAPESHRADWNFNNPLWSGFLPQTVDALKRSLSFAKNNSLFLIAGIMGMIWDRFKDKRLIWIFIGVLLCGAAWFITPIKLLFQPYLGFLAGYQLDRFYLFAPFFVAIFVGYGLDKVPTQWVVTNKKMTTPKEWNLRTILVLFVCLFLLFHSAKLKYSHARKWVTGNTYAVNYRNAQMESLANKNSSSTFRVATITGGQLHPAFANAYGLETADGYVTLYPQTYQDFWGQVIKPLTSKDQQRKNYFHDWGNRVYLFSPSSSFEQEKINFSQYYNLNLLSLANVKYIISRNPVKNKALKLLPNQDPSPKTRWNALSFTGKLKRGISNNFTGRELYIYKNKNVLPRFFLADQVKSFKSSAKLLKLMARSQVETLRHNIFLKSKAIPNQHIEELGFTKGDISVETKNPDKIVLNVDLDGSGILAITNNYSPYWKARVNGASKEIFPIYHTFSGIYLSEGENEITLIYDPPYWPPY